MTASWPAAKKTFTQIVDGTHYMEGVNCNVVYDEVEAMQVSIGPPGAAQTHNAALLAMLQGNYIGGRCYKKDANEIYVGSFRGIVPNSAGSIRKLRVKTSVTTLSASELDTGSMAVGYYYIYATADAAGTEPVFVFSASASAPSGYTNYQKIGWFYNETASVLDITKNFVGNYRDGSDNPNIVTAIGTSDISTSSTTFVDMADTEVRFVSNGRPVLILFNAIFYQNVNNGNIAGIAINVDSSNVRVKRIRIQDQAGMDRSADPPLFYLDGLSAGEHTIKIQWKISVDTLYQYGNNDDNNDYEGPRIVKVWEL